MIESPLICICRDNLKDGPYTQTRSMVPKTHGNGPCVKGLHINTWGEKAAADDAPSAMRTEFETKLEALKNSQEHTPVPKDATAEDRHAGITKIKAVEMPDEAVDPALDINAGPSDRAEPKEAAEGQVDMEIPDAKRLIAPNIAASSHEQRTDVTIPAQALRPPQGTTHINARPAAQLETPAAAQSSTKIVTSMLAAIDHDQNVLKVTPDVTLEESTPIAQGAVALPRAAIGARGLLDFDVTQKSAHNVQSRMALEATDQTSAKPKTAPVISSLSALYADGSHRTTVMQLPQNIKMDPAMVQGTPVPSAGGFSELSVTVEVPKAHLMASTDAGRLAWQQTTMRLQQPMHGAIEIELQPMELGRLNIRIESLEGQTRVILQAERPETLEAMRRSYESFAQDLKEMGFRALEFQFKSQRDTAGQTRAPVQLSDHEENAAAESPPLSGTFAQNTAQRGHSTSIIVRI